MHVLIVEPFFAGSHANWAKGFQKYSAHQVSILSLPGRHWKWRMHGGAITLAKQFVDSGLSPDVILATEMLDVSTFRNLIAERWQGPIGVYFHENQLTYPWSDQDQDLKLQRDNHYSFINYTSALVADRVFFNSSYHKSSFLNELPKFLRQFPDHQNLETISTIASKSKVLYLGLDLQALEAVAPTKIDIDPPIILWNHRWEYDKNPELFFSVLAQLNIPFQLVVLGASFKSSPSTFEKAKSTFANQILHWGFTESFDEYASWLWKADIALTTSFQDYFGGSVVEAIYCQCFPLLPNRLSYPEHIPNHLKSKVLYDDEKDLLNKLEEALQNPAPPTTRLTLQQEVAKYDWGEMVNIYDKELTSLKNECS